MLKKKTTFLRLAFGLCRLSEEVIGVLVKILLKSLSTLRLRFLVVLLYCRMPRENEDRLLVKDFLAGDQSACNTVYGYIDGALSGWAKRLKSDIDDVRQDTIIELFDEFLGDKFEFRSSVKTFVNTVAFRTAYDRVYARRWITDNEEVLAQQPSKQLTGEEDLAVAQQFWLSFRVLKLIGKKCRRLFRRFYKEDKSQKDIGLELGIEEKTVRSRLFQCRKKAREIREKILENNQHPGSGPA